MKTVNEAEASREHWDRVHLSYERDRIPTDPWLDRFAFPNISGKAALDLGCGSGNDTKALLEKGARVTACDLSGNAIRNIIVNFPEVEEARCLNMLDGLPFPDGSFDLVCADLSLHYFTREDTEGVIREIGRVLTDRGYLTVRVNSVSEIPVRQDLEAELSPRLFRTKDGRLARFFNEEDIRYFFGGLTFLTMAEEKMPRYGTDKTVWTLCLRKDGER